MTTPILDPTVPQAAADWLESPGVRWVRRRPGDGIRSGCLHTALLQPCAIPGDNAIWHVAYRWAEPAVWSSSGPPAAPAAPAAASALVVRDLIGQHGFTADDYRALTARWASVVGPVHPDDVRDGLVAS